MCKVIYLFICRRPRTCSGAPKIRVSSNPRRVINTPRFDDDIFSLAKNNDCEDVVVEFGSTSKITFAGAGVGFIAMSELNQE